MSSVLKIEDLHKTFNSGDTSLHILHGINLEICTGEKVAIIGQSGSGKSTFLQIVGLLDTATKGEIYVNGAKVSSMRDSEKSENRLNLFGFVYQSHHLLSDFTALENVLMPARIQGDITEDDKQYAEQLLDKVGLVERLNHFPSQLSGGEQQRVAIARALMNKPKLLLADEPTGNLDPETALEISNLLNELVKEQGLSILLVTHNHELAGDMDKIYVMEKGVLSHGG